ncbi:MAG: ethylbenzene dehydrogenase-related protein [Rhodocyclaceae bacterium]|nr:ethylbenzene dehydrogenase-related protein [Rhodocyclaceae bacterium]
MDKHAIAFPALTLAAALAAGGALAAPPDWSKVPAKKFTVFYPGVSPVEWIMNGVEHSGAKGLRKGETCTSCHQEEADNLVIGQKMVSGEKIEPKPIKGKVAAFPVNVQAANDGTHLYLRFSWKQPPGGGPKMDADNQVKLAFMLAEDGIMAQDAKGKEVDMSKAGGCWATCHDDLRTMPNAKDDKKTKYIKTAGKFYDLVQWASKANKGSDGMVADKRVMDNGKALVEAKGENKGGEWSVVFTRKLSGGGEGDLALASGKTYNFGFAIHDDYTNGRFHHVSLGYTLGIDTKADLSANK